MITYNDEYCWYVWADDYRLISVFGVVIIIEVDYRIV